MSNPRASIQRAVTAPPAEAGAASTVMSPTHGIDEGKPARALIGKAHGRMRSVNLCLPIEAAETLRRLTAERESTLGEVLIDIVRHVQVPATQRADGRRPSARRHTLTSSVYVLPNCTSRCCARPHQRDTPTGRRYAVDP